MELNLRRTIGYLMAMQRQQWASLLAYRAQAVLWFTLSAFNIINSFVTIFVIYSISAGIAGWTYYQVLVLISLTSIFMGTMYYLVSPYDILWKLRTGYFDAYMTKPYGLFSIIGLNFSSPESVVTIASGLVLLIYSLNFVSFSTVSFLAFIVLFVLGAAAAVTFFTAVTVLAYHLFRGSDFISRMLTVVNNASRFPLDIYGRLGVVLLSTVLPIGLAYYFPAEALFGTLSLSGFLAVAALTISICIASYKSFYWLMKKYTSGQG